ncbi:Cilia- and flagella-associated protein 74 [Liparis tanakae]|uniref:Cilia-and flagella-associated protein 74 n=1 Tax=Liparis tanakae TaxID=230148 RepID=A0A4Z2G5Q8_9TELE|nr:Cilia- and flagella-associated protein 74 [Liparis tanakae]
MVHSLHFRPYNTLFLKLQCPAVQPPLVVVSGGGKNGVDFHQVALGVKVIHRLTIQNISRETLDYCETLGVRSQTMTLEIALRGEGVGLAVTSSHPGGPLDFGYVMEKEGASHVLKSEVCAVDLRGAASSHNMYVTGGDRLTVPIDSPLPPLIHGPVEEKPPPTPVLVTLRASCGAGGGVSPAERELQVGCVRSTIEKKGDFHWDNVASLQQLGFSLEPSKGTVKSGHKRTITVTWTPPSGYKPYEVVQTCLPLTLKGDETNVYSVNLMAFLSNNTQ